MKRLLITFTELLYGLTFLLYLVGSTLTHIENGSELSLWLMALAMIISAATTLLSLLDVRWLKLSPMGCRGGFWLAMTSQVASWFTYAYAMFCRLNRSLLPFHRFIGLTTLLWAIWMLIFIYSRHACYPQKKAGKYEETRPIKSTMVRNEEK